MAAMKLILTSLLNRSPMAILILRYLFGLTENALIAGAVDSNAIRSNSTEIQAYLQLGVDTGALDIDDNGEVKSLTDGLLVLRYLFGFRGLSLIDGSIGNNATRIQANEIEDYVESLVQ